MLLFRGRICFLFLAVCGSTWANIIPSAPFISVSSTLSSRRTSTLTPSIDADHVALSVRGGASKSKRKQKAKTASLHGSSSSKKKKSATGKPAVGAASTADKPTAIESALQKYRSMLPLTRAYMTAIGIVTSLFLLLGEEGTQTLLALDPIRTFYGLELWRPFSAASFLGKPSMSWLMSAYYLFEYGSTLERAFGTAQHFVFLFSQLVLLTALSVLLTQPFFGQSMITAMLHVLSRSMPNQKVKWVIFTVPYWSLPYALLLSDVLQAESAVAAAVPHVLGILTGHCYYFHKFVWPKSSANGEDWLVPPEFLRNLLEKSESNDKQKERLSAALKKRKRGKGRKLGS